MSEGNDLLKSFLTIFEIDRVDERLSLAKLESVFDDHWVCGVDHQGQLDHSSDEIEKLHHVSVLIAIGISHADVEDVRPSSCLRSTNLCTSFVGSLCDEFLESAASDHICSFANDEGIAIFLDQK